MVLSTVSCVSVFSTVMTATPDNTTVFLNSRATFICEVSSSYAWWIVNDTVENDWLSAEIFRDLDTAVEFGETVLRRLTIPGTAKYNGTRVQCVVAGVVHLRVENLRTTGVREEGREVER